MKLQELAQTVAAETGTDPKTAAQVMRSMMNLLKNELDEGRPAVLPVLGRITSRPKTDGSGEKIFILHRRKETESED